MSGAKKADQVMGSDGLPARESGEWAEQKLAFINEFGPVALTATRSMPHRAYVDLFAGPGLNRVRNGTHEFDGSALRVLELVSDRDPRVPFTECWFVNQDEIDHKALTERVRRRSIDGRSQVPLVSTHCILGDANAEVRRILDAIDQRTFILAFADPESPKQCHWSTIEALRRYRHHESVDLYMLFPLGMALQRLVSHNPKTVAEAAPTLDAFFGCDRWRSLLRHRDVSSKANSDELARSLLGLYVERLHELWEHVDVVADIRRGTNHKLYKMIFASNADAGKRISKWAKNRAASQTDLGL